MLAGTNRERINRLLFFRFPFPTEVLHSAWDVSLAFPQLLAKNGFRGHCHNLLGSGALGPVTSEVGGTLVLSLAKSGGKGSE